MPTPHIAAADGEIAPLVLMPGDPRRATRIAELLLDDARLVTDVRGILGYTGSWHGAAVTVMASGMGVPSISIYATELYRAYGVRRIVRVGTAGRLSADVRIGDTIIAASAHTDSSVAHAVPGVTLSFAASVRPLSDAVAAAGRGVLAGPVFTTDAFYRDRPDLLDALDRRGTLAVEMEAAGLYAVAAEEGTEALALLTISDDVRTGEGMTAQERETTFATTALLAAHALTGRVPAADG